MYVVSVGSGCTGDTQGAYDSKVPICKLFCSTAHSADKNLFGNFLLTPSSDALVLSIFKYALHHIKLP